MVPLGYSYSQNEIDNRLLRPASVVAIRRCDKCAVAAVRGFYEADGGICGQLCPGFWQDADEGIVFCVQNQCGNTNLFHNPGCGGPMVVVVGSGEAFVAGRDLVIEFSNARETA